MSVAILEEHSILVEDRNIHDNVITGYESIHTMRRERFGNGDFRSLKLDLSKAYDRVEWNFLEAMMARLGYAQQWIAKVMKCVTPVKFTFNINDYLVWSATLQRGLRQGDALSPFLLLFVAEGLSGMLQKREEVGSLRGIRFGIEGPRVSHLLFADDSFVSFKATINEGIVINSTLDEYLAASVQVVNFDKAEICFGRDVDERMGEEIATRLGFLLSKFH